MTYALHVSRYGPIQFRSFMYYQGAQGGTQTQTFCMDKDLIKNPDTVFNALKTSIKSTKEVKFKFGIKVPHNMREAMHLDQIENDGE